MFLVEHGGEQLIEIAADKTATATGQQSDQFLTSELAPFGGALERGFSEPELPRNFTVFKSQKPGAESQSRSRRG